MDEKGVLSKLEEGFYVNVTLLASEGSAVIYTAPDTEGMDIVMVKSKAQ
jgi:hypothetical protein